eukprot:4842262-Pyramimonas_sp.AAC.1
MATGAIYGARDAGRQWYFYAQKVFAEHGFVESKLGKGLYYFYDEDGLAAVVHSHVDDFLIASVTIPPSGRPLSHRWGRGCTSSQSKGSSSTADARLPSSTTSSA